MAIEAYKVGINLALSGNIAKAVSDLVKEFDNLNKIVQQVQMSVNEMAAGMRGLQRIGASAAASWKEAAGAMERAARAARSAGASMSSVGGGAAPSNNNARQQRQSGPLMLGYSGPNDPGFRLNGPAYGPGTSLVPTGREGTYVNSPQRGSLVPYQPFPVGTPGGTGFTMGLNPIPLGGLPRVPVPAPDWMTAGVGYGAVGLGGQNFLEASFEARAATEVERTKMRLNKFSEEQIKRADEIAHKLQRDVPGVSIVGGLKAVNELFTLTQNIEESLDSGTLTEYAKYDQVTAAFNKKKEGENLWSGLQSGELRGLLTDPVTKTISLDKIKAFLYGSSLTTARTMGRFGPDEQLQVLRSAGIEGGMMDADTLFKDMPALAIGMRAANAGTGLQGLAMQITGGKMSEGAGLMMAEGDMLRLPKGAPSTHPKTPGEKKMLLKWMRDHYKNGIGQFLFPPEVNPYAKEGAVKPIDFTMTVLKNAADAFMKEHHIVPTDEQDRLLRRQQWALAFASRIPGGKAVAMAFRDMLLIERDRKAWDELKAQYDKEGKTPYDVVKDSPKIQVEAFHASMNAFLEQMGGVMMKEALEVLKKLTEGLNAITDWARANPGAAKTLMEFAAGLTAVSLAVAGISGVALVAGPMLGVARFGLDRLRGGVEALNAINMAELGAGIRGVARALAGLGVGAGVAAAMKFGSDWLANKVDQWATRRTDEEQAQHNKMLDQLHEQGRQQFLHGLNPMNWFGGTPKATPQSYLIPGRQSSASDLIYVHVVNGKDIANGTIGYMARRAERAPAGSSRFDSSMAQSYPSNALRA